MQIRTSYSQKHSSRWDEQIFSSVRPKIRKARKVMSEKLTFREFPKTEIYIKTCEKMLENIFFYFSRAQNKKLRTQKNFLGNPMCFAVAGVFVTNQYRFHFIYVWICGNAKYGVPHDIVVKNLPRIETNNVWIPTFEIFASWKKFFLEKPLLDPLRVRFA